MAPSARRLLLVLLVSFALLTNSFWLFPDEGEMRYTYERSELVPEGDETEYDPQVQVAERGYYNDLHGVGCESVFGDRVTDRDLTARTCAFEQALADGASVSVEGYDRRASGAVSYVELDDGYYRLTVESNGSSIRLDVRRVSAEAMLANVTARPPVEEVSGAAVGASDVALRAVGLGETVETVRPPSEVEVGTVFTLEGRYYAVFVTDSEVVTSPVPEFVRLAGQLLGFAGALSTVLLLGARLSVAVE